MVDYERTFEERVSFLKDKAIEVRTKIVYMIWKAQSGHPGGALSATDVMTALYFDLLNIRPEEPRWPERDRLVLSKGHTCPVWYSCLALRGYFPINELDTLRKFESILQGHPVLNKTPGVDMTTGSLGQGLSMGVGMALNGRIEKSNYKVHVIMGDGEIQEGQVWEAAMAASAYNLENLIAVVDRNNLQNDGFVDTIMPVDPVTDKFAAFGWNVMTMNGHNMAEVLSTLINARAMQNGKPTVIVSKTVKGRGVSLMENVRAWHGKAPNDEQYKIALKDIAGGLK